MLHSAGRADESLELRPISDEAEELVRKAWDGRRAEISAQDRLAREMLQRRRTAYLRRRAEEAEAAWQRRAAAAEVAERARQEAAANGILRAWAARLGHTDILGAIEGAEGAEAIAEAVRRKAFQPLADLVPFRKITKADLLVANPNLRDDAAALKATFSEEESGISSQGSAVFDEIVRRLLAAEVPVQFSVRRHRGRLTRREVPVGVGLEACSVLVTAVFGALTVSRAIALGGRAPAEEAEVDTA